MSKDLKENIGNKKNKLKQSESNKRKTNSKLESSILNENN